MLNLIGMLMAPVKPLGTSREGERRNITGLPRGSKTPEMLAKRKVTMRANRNARWREAFFMLNNEATSSQLAGKLGRSVTSINSALVQMRKEVPPVVEIVRSEASGARTNGGRKYVYRWIGD